MTVTEPERAKRSTVSRFVKKRSLWKAKLLCTAITKETLWGNFPNKEGEQGPDTLNSEPSGIHGSSLQCLPISAKLFSAISLYLDSSLKRFHSLSGLKVFSSSALMDNQPRRHLLASLYVPGKIQKRFLFLNYLHSLQDPSLPSSLDSSVNFSIRPSLVSLFLKCVHVLILQHFLNFLLSLSSSIHQHLIYYVIYKHICLWYVSYHHYPSEYKIHVFVLLSCCVWLFATPWTAACQAPRSTTVFQSLLKFMPTELVMLSNHLILSFPCFF